jgi:hypothetical protein
MPDVTFYNYPYNQYVFTSAGLKRVLLRQQGCDEWSRRPAPGYGAGGLYGAGYGGYGAAPQAGSGIGGAVLGGVAGLAAGYALSKAMEGDHGAAGEAHRAAPANEGYIPFDTPQAPDMGSFDAGSGSGWDAADSGGGDSGGDW